MHICVAASTNSLPIKTAALKTDLFMIARSGPCAANRFTIFAL
jgi:hypothetical protein